jgi:hypothetical protein
VLDQHGGIRQQPIAPEQASVHPLRRTVIRLARLISEQRPAQRSPGYGGPRGRTVFFLQARPITVVPDTESGRTAVWTNANLGEGSRM